MNVVNQIMQSDPLVKLVQEENFVGWVYSIDYDSALVMTNDLWKVRALGIPHNCFLIATAFKPEQFSQVPVGEREAILLRVVGTCKLPQDDDIVRTKVDYFQDQTGIFGVSGVNEFDDLTQGQLQFGGLSCRVLGTFYTEGGELHLGSDIESFATAARLNVYRPRGAALHTIVNYVDPIRRRTAIEDAKLLGITNPVKDFRIGTVRYTSTDRLHRRDEAEKVAVSIPPSDFLARRTAVLGMTRTGKSNMIKQLVAVVKRVADEGGIHIGQIIYDINGEYANANQQDKGSIADIYPNQTVRYRMLKTPGFEELQNNFYIQLTEGQEIITRVIEENYHSSSNDINVFKNMSLDEPDAAEIGEHNRWEVRVAAYQALLHKAGFLAPANFTVRFTANQQVRNAVDAAVDPGKGLTLDQAVDWFLIARDLNRQNPFKSSSGKDWFDTEAVAILNMLANKNANDAFIIGFKVLLPARDYHTPRRSREVGDEIYDHLLAGKIVILDLSVGNPTLRERLSKQIASDIFNKSMMKFVEGKAPPNIVVYIEEAHNLIGKQLDLTETWPRLAKEGAKYRIALVYATQEVSSVHPNILSNTENWFISHLNNDREIKELARFYDFEDFSRSLLRAQDVGFARVKTLSSPFVIPVQIDKFDPQFELARMASLQSSTTGNGSTSTNKVRTASEPTAMDALWQNRISDED
jgi:hypothetical protein